MGDITLITGGCRSGKSAYAEKYAVNLSGNKTYIATCPIIDNEMELRVKKHKESRGNSDWITVEEQLELSKAIQTAGKGVILIECLSLWVNNLLFRSEYENREFLEEDIHNLTKDVLAAANAHKGSTIFVSNETGMGIVPDNRLSRLYVDILGRCNQLIANSANRVIFMVSGLPVAVK